MFCKALRRLCLFFCIWQFWYQNSRFAVQTRHQQLIDLVVIDIHHFKFVARILHRVGAFRDFTQHEHHKAADGFIVAGLWELVDIQHAHNVINRRTAINQP